MIDDKKRLLVRDIKTLPWNHIYRYVRVNYKKKYIWKLLLKHKNISEILLSEYIDYIDWSGLNPKINELSTEFLRRYHKKLDWSIIPTKQFVESKYLEMYEDKIDFNKLYYKTNSKFKYSLTLLNRHANVLNPSLVVQYNITISEKRISDILKNLKFNMIHFYSRHFILNQKMSYDFIIEHFKYFDTNIKLFERNPNISIIDKEKLRLYLTYIK